MTEQDKIFAYVLAAVIFGFAFLIEIIRLVIKIIKNKMKKGTIEKKKGYNEPYNKPVLAPEDVTFISKIPLSLNDIPAVSKEEISDEKYFLSVIEEGRRRGYQVELTVTKKYK